MSNSVRPHRRQPIWLPLPWDSPGKNIGVGCHFFLQFSFKIGGSYSSVHTGKVVSNSLWPHGPKPTRLLCPWNSLGKNTGVGCHSLHYFHYLHHSLASRSNNREGIQPHPPTENWIKDLLSMAPPIRTRSSFPLNLSHQEASISLLSFSIRGQTAWKPQSQKTNQTDHMDHSLI